MTDFEWDESKRLANIDKHGIDFLDAAEVFTLPFLQIDGRSEVEKRSIAVAPVNGVMMAVVFTVRDGVYRLISARRARRDERERYQALLAGRPETSEE
jgi:uncharacterized DUF497 family protein